MNWYTSDQHFQHTRILEYCKRPFSDTREMEKALIENFCALVKPEDTTYHLGDLMMSRTQHPLNQIMPQLPGRHILILGNHDQLEPFKYIDLGFESVHTSLEVDLYDLEEPPDPFVPECTLILAHDPAVATVAENRQFLCGHVHKLFKQVKNVINVGIDVWDFKPVSEKQILELIRAI